MLFISGSKSKYFPSVGAVRYPGLGHFSIGYGCDKDMPISLSQHLAGKSLRGIRVLTIAKLPIAIQDNLMNGKKVVELHSPTWW